MNEGLILQQMNYTMNECLNTCIEERMIIKFLEYMSPH